MAEPVSPAGVTEDTPLDIVERGLRTLGTKMPGSVRFRLESSLEHFERAFRLFEIDREMASFRAITGEEEAASSLIKAIQLRGYPHARVFNSRDHQHKAAVLACVSAIARQVAPIFQEFQLTFDFEKKRVDVKLPLSNFNVAGGENFAIQFVEPLEVSHQSTSSTETRPFAEALQSLAAELQYDNIRRMVAEAANGRNKLLYASDNSLPVSNATQADLLNRKKRGLVMLVLSAMILQTRKHQSLVCQAIEAFLGVISRLPPAYDFGAEGSSLQSASPRNGN